MRLRFSADSASIAVRIAICLLFAIACTHPLRAADKKPAANPAPDVLVLSNGDTLHGKFVGEIGGKVTFHSDALGDISVPWAKIKELRTAEPYAVLNGKEKLRGKQVLRTVPVGTLDVASQNVTVHPANAAAPAPIPTKDAQYIMEESTLKQQLYHEPGFLTGWNGAATAGATLVTATQNQYTFSGAAALARVVPSISWLDRRNRTSVGFSGSFGKITQPAYTIPATATSPATVVAATTTKTAIYHAGAERDQYMSSRFFALANLAFDHNFSQDLNLQQIYGGGIGWTAIQRPKQSADLKATLQYEKQQFISGTSGTNQNLIGSTFSADYALHLKRVNYAQTLEFIPAYNNTRAYSTSETDTFAFPSYKNFSFSLGTLDTYLNDAPVSLPPTRRNSFQFTMGLTYAIKSKY